MELINGAKPYKGWIFLFLFFLYIKNGASYPRCRRAAALRAKRGGGVGNSPQQESFKALMVLMHNVYLAA